MIGVLRGLRDSARESVHSPNHSVNLACHLFTFVQETTTTTMTRRRDTRYDLDDSSSAEESKPPTAVAQFTFLALGVSCLLPWNALIIALPYFLEKLSGTSLHDTFPSWLSFLFNGAGLLAMGLATWLGDKIGPRTITPALIALTSLFGFLAIIPFLELSPIHFFITIILTCSVLASSCGLLQTSTVALAPRYGTSSITSYMAGSALSAVGVSVLQVFTAYTSTGLDLPGMGSATWSAVVCFATAALLCLATLVAYRVLIGDELEVGCDDFKDIGDVPVSEHSRLLGSSVEPAFPPPLRAPSSRHRSAFGLNFAVFYSAVVTLGLFPAITTLIEPTGTHINPLVFNALHFLIFNVADLIGRALTSVPCIPTNNTSLVTYSLVRTIFVPLFLMCNVPGQWPTIITSNIVYMFILFLFGLSCGHTTTLALVTASEGEDPTMARVAQFWMMSGFVVGGVASFGVGAIL